MKFTIVNKPLGELIGRRKQHVIMSVSTKAAVLSVLALSTVAVLYWNKDFLSEEFECICSDAKKEEALRKLQRVRIVLHDFATELNRVEEACEKSKLSGEKVDPEIKRMIPGLSVDLDYIFDTLDAIQGDTAVKTRRKKLVDEFKALAQRVDNLTVFMR